MPLGSRTFYDTSGTLSLPDGVKTAPSLYFDNASQTGLYHPGSQELGLVASGKEHLTVTSTGVTLGQDPTAVSTINGAMTLQGLTTFNGVTEFNDELNAGDVTAVNMVAVGDMTCDRMYASIVDTTGAINAGGNITTSGTTNTGTLDVNYTGDISQLRLQRQSGAYVVYHWIASGNNYHIQNSSGNALTLIEHSPGGGLIARPLADTTTNTYFGVHVGNGTGYDTVMDVDENEQVVNVPATFNDVVQLGASTVAGLPAGSAGDVLFCTDETGGATVVYYDGTNWRRVYDNAIAS